MDLSLFDYYLPKELIAQEPIEPRDYSRLMILERKRKALIMLFLSITKLFNSARCFGFNNSKVVPARLKGRKKILKGKQNYY